MLTKRTHIMLDPEIWSNLSSLAKMQETTTGALIRNAIEKTYFKTPDDESTQRHKSIENIRKHRVRVPGINYKEYINWGRKY